MKEFAWSRNGAFWGQDKKAATHIPKSACSQLVTTPRRVHKEPVAAAPEAAAAREPRAGDH